MKKYEIDLLEVKEWSDIFIQFEDNYSFKIDEHSLPAFISALKLGSSTETLLIIKNPMIGFGFEENNFRTRLLEIATVINTERLASGMLPTIKVAFAQ